MRRSNCETEGDKVNGANPLAAEILETSATGFAAAANALMERSQPDLRERDAGVWQAHLRQRILELAAAVRIGDPGMFTRRVRWLLRAAEARGSEQESLRLALQSLRSALDTELPAHLRNAVVPLIEKALDQPDYADDDTQSLLDAESRYGRIAQTYIELCLDGDTSAAAQSILAEIDNGLDVRHAYTDVLLPAEKEIGHRWHLGQATVAEERIVSETTRRLMSQLAARYAPKQASGPTMLAASVSGNAHDIGLRAVSDLFMLAGWRCLFLGANVPAADVAAAAKKFEVALVILTATLSTQLNALSRTIEAIRERAPDAKVLVGGSAFDETLTLWEQIGADGFAADVEDTVAAGNRLLRR